MELPTPENIRELIRKHNIKIVDLKFNDLPGIWQHFSIPVEELEAGAVWDDGVGFDGSSIRGFQKIQESDMNLFLDATPAVLAPTSQRKRSPTQRRRASPTRATGGQSSSSSSSTTSASTRPRTPATTTSTRSRASGTPVVTSGHTWATTRATRKAT